MAHVFTFIVTNRRASLPTLHQLDFWCIVANIWYLVFSNAFAVEQIVSLDTSDGLELVGVAFAI